MTERQISDGLCAYLRKEGLSFVRARTDKKSGIQEGWPDVTVVHCSRAWLCELKTPTGRLSPKQVECHAKLKRNGTPVTVARSVGEAVNAVKAFFGILTPGEQENDIQDATERQKGQSIPAPNPLLSHFFIADVSGHSFVFEQLDERLGACANRLLRKATQWDLLHISRR